MTGLDPGIRLQAVWKSFGTQAALADIDLDVSAGSYVAVMGGNGAGKTTLLKVIAGLASPSRGRVTVAGVDMRRAGPRLRRLVGFVSHESMLYPDLTGRENLTFYAGLFGLRRPADEIARVADLLGVERALDRPVRQLSRGTRQRVTLARALLHSPVVLLLDEPYTGLDEAAAAGLTEMLDELHTPARVLMIALHEVARAIAGPERLVVLNEGRIVLDAPVRERPGAVADQYLALLRSEVPR